MLYTLLESAVFVPLTQRRGKWWDGVGLELSRHKHVSGWEEGVRVVTLIHNNYPVLNVDLHEVNPEGGAASYPTPTYLDWAPHQHIHIW